MAGRVQVGGSLLGPLSKLSPALGAAGGCVWEDVRLGLCESYMLNYRCCRACVAALPTFHLGPGIDCLLERPYFQRALDLSWAQLLGGSFLLWSTLDYFDNFLPRMATEIFQNTCFKLYSTFCLYHFTNWAKDVLLECTFETIIPGR